MKHNILSNLTGVMLLGGQGRRMGYINKSQLKIDDITFGEKIIQTLSMFPTVLLSAKEPSQIQPLLEKEINLPIVYDIVDAGPLGAIYSILKESPTEEIFIISCDMPYVDQDLISYIISNQDKNFWGVMPKIKNNIEPLCSIYSKKMLPFIKLALDENIYSIQKAMEKCNIKYLDLTGTPHSLKFLNINEPKDYNKISKN